MIILGRKNKKSSYIGHVQSFGPKRPVVAAVDRPRPPSPRPLPRPPPPEPPTPAGRAVPQRLQTPRNAKLTLEQLLK